MYARVSRPRSLSISDEQVRHGVEMGNLLSRSLLYFFKHNDMEELESVLKEITAKARPDKNVRRWIVVEVRIHRGVRGTQQ